MVFLAYLRGLRRIVAVEPSAKRANFLAERRRQLRRTVPQQGEILVVRKDVAQARRDLARIVKEQGAKFVHVVCHDVIELLPPRSVETTDRVQPILQILAQHKLPGRGTLSFSTVEWLFNHDVADFKVFESLLNQLEAHGLTAQDMVQISVPRSFGIPRGIVLSFNPPEPGAPTLTERISATQQEVQRWLRAYEASRQSIRQRVPESAGHPPSSEALMSAVADGASAAEVYIRSTELMKVFYHEFSEKIKRWPVGGGWPSDSELQDLTVPLYRMRFLSARWVVLERASRAAGLEELPAIRTRVLPPGSPTPFARGRETQVYGEVKELTVKPVMAYYTTPEVGGALAARLEEAQRRGDPPGLTLAGLTLRPLPPTLEPPPYSLVVKALGELLPQEAAWRQRRVAVVELAPDATWAQLLRQALIQWTGDPDLGAILRIERRGDRLAIYL